MKSWLWFCWDKFSETTLLGNDILKRLPGECGTPVCMPATWKMLKKKVSGKSYPFYSLSAKKHISRYMLVGCSRYTASSRSAYFSGTRMMLYLNWDWLHQQTVRSLCSLLLWFGHFIVTTDARLEPKCRSKTYLSVRLCHLSTDAAVMYGYAN